MNTLSIITIIASIFGPVLIFWRLAPSAIVAYAAIVCACFSGAGGEVTVSGNGMLFWGVASVIILGLQFIKTDNPLLTRLSSGYISAGAIVGGVLGLLSGHTASTIIVASALGAILGLMAYSRTPSGAGVTSDRHRLGDLMGAAGLPAVVIAGMSFTALSAILY